MHKSFITSLFSTSISDERLTHAYLFYGMNHQDLIETTRHVITLFLNHHHPEYSLSWDTKSHPDIIELSDLSSIKIEHIKDLQERIKYGAHSFKKCFVIIYNCDYLTPQAANAFLKTLEEPHDDIVFLMTTSHIQHTLPTIQSRSTTLFVPTSPVPFDQDTLVSFPRFYAMSLIERFSFCMSIVKDKQLVQDQLYYWLDTLSNDSSHTYTCYQPFILKILNHMQFNINLRLHLETLSLEIPFQ